MRHLESELNTIGLITVTYNSSALAHAFAASARHFRHVIVVDNASRDGSPNVFGTELPRANVLRQPVNLGFGAANNIGLAEAVRLGLPYVLFMNPDCSISADSVLLLKQTLAQHPQAAIASPVVLNKDGIAGRLLRWDYRLPYEAWAPQSTEIADLQGQIADHACIDGACFMVRTDLFLKAGAFSDDLFLFSEEADVNLRVARAGYQSLFNPAATSKHIGGASTPPSLRIELLRAYHARWSRMFMTDRYISRSARKKEAVRVVLAAPFALLLYALTFNRKLMMRWLGWGMAGIDGLFMTKYFRRWL